MKKILVVDDERAMRDLFEIFFTNNCGYQVILAENGQRGLDIFMQEVPDLIITDINMPVMDGRDMVMSIRASLFNAPVIFMSGISENFKGLEEIEGAFFMEKPLSLKKMAKKIEELLLKN